MELKWGLSVNKWSNVKCSDVNWRDLCVVILFWSEVMWSVVMWTDVIYVKWFCFEVKWREV